MIETQLHFRQMQLLQNNRRSNRDEVAQATNDLAHSRGQSRQRCAKRTQSRGSGRADARLKAREAELELYLAEARPVWMCPPGIPRQKGRPGTTGNPIGRISEERANDGEAHCPAHASGWQSNDPLRYAKVPLPDSDHVKIIEATAEQILAALEFVRRWLAEKECPRAFADGVAHRLLTAGAVTAADYAEAMFTADGQDFMHGKLVAPPRRYHALDAALSPLSGNPRAGGHRAMVARGLHNATR
jgi:hypothetical protein